MRAFGTREVSAIRVTFTFASQRIKHDTRRQMESRLYLNSELLLLLDLPSYRFNYINTEVNIRQDEGRNFFSVFTDTAHKG